MELSKTCASGAVWRVEFDEFNIERVWRNNKRVRNLSEWREDRIWNAFNNSFDLRSELADHRHEKEENWFVNY